MKIINERETQNYKKKTKAKTEKDKGTEAIFKW